MAKRTLPDGQVANFPDTMSDADIDAVIAKKFGGGEQMIQPQQTQDDGNLLDKVMRYGVKGPLAGTAKLGRNIADLPPTVGNWIAEKLGAEYRMPYTQITDEEIYNLMGLPPAEEQDAGDFISQLIPDIAGAIAAPELQLGRAAQLLGKAPGILGKILPKTVSQAGTQALYGAAASPEGQRGQGALMGGLLTAPLAGAARAAQVTPSVPLRHALGLGGATLTGGLGYQLGKGMGLSPMAAGTLGTVLGGLGYRGIASPQGKLASQFEGVDLTDPKVIERLEAAERLGVNITPAEAEKSQYLAGEHAKLGRSSEGSKKYFEAAEKRIGQEERAINKLLETVFDVEKMPEQITAGYEKVYPKQVPPTMGLKYSGNKTLENITKKIEKDAELMEKATKAGITVGEGANQKLDKTKLGYWDMMKKYLDKEVGRVSSPDAPSIDKLKADSFDTLRKDIVKDLDPLFPEYKKVRSLSEREHARNTIQKAFRKSDVGGKQIYDAFKDKPKFDELMMHLRDVPEAQSILKDMKMIFEESKKKPSLSTTAVLKGTGLDQDRNLKNSIVTFLKKWIVGEKYDASAIDVLYSGKWQEAMKDINKISDSQKKVSAFIELLGDVSGAAGRKSLEND